MNKISTEQLTGTAVKKARRVAGNKGLLRTVLLFIVPALLVIGGGYYWLTSGGSVSTDDAQVKQDIVSVSAQVNGPIVQVLVRNGTQVKQGDKLFFRARYAGFDAKSAATACSELKKLNIDCLAMKAD